MTTTTVRPAFTRREQEILDLLTAHPGPTSVAGIALVVSGSADDSAVNSVRVWLHRLRKKGVTITTVKHGMVMLGECEQHVFVCACCGMRLEHYDNVLGPAIVTKG